MDTAGGRGTWPGEGPTPFRGWRQSVRVVDSRRYRAIAGRTACVCAAERGSREEMGRCAIATFNLRPQEFDEVKKLNFVEIPACVCCWRAIPIMWVRVDCAKTVRRNAPLEPHDGRVGVETLPTSLAVDACSRILHKSWSHRNCGASALKCGASYCVSLEQTEREAQPVMLAFTFMGTTRELFADMTSA